MDHTAGLNVFEKRQKVDYSGTILRDIQFTWTEITLPVVYETYIAFACTMIRQINEDHEFETKNP